MKNESKKNESKKNVPIHDMDKNVKGESKDGQPMEELMDDEQLEARHASVEEIENFDANAPVGVIEE